MNEVRLSDETKSDLAEIWLHIAQDSPSAADRQLGKFLDRFAILARFPEMGQACRDVQEGLRQFSIGSYVIFYRPIKGGVEIARVVSGARDTDAIL